MAIKGKRNVSGGSDKPVSSSSLFTKQEASFVASKLTQAQYTGAEFDQYFKIMQKLKSTLDKG